VNCVLIKNSNCTATQHVDLSALDVYLWRHVTTLVCSATVEYQETLHQRNLSTC